MSENPRSVVFELKIVFRGGDEFVSGTAYCQGCPKVSRLEGDDSHISKENLCLASKSAGVSSRSIFALILETVKRIPVNMLYAVT